MNNVRAETVSKAGNTGGGVGRGHFFGDAKYFRRFDL